MSCTSSHIVSPAPGRNSFSLPSEVGNIPFDGDNRSGKQKSDVFIGKQGSLFNSFLSDTDKPVLTKSCKTFILIDR